MTTTQSDSASFASRIDLKNISAVEARILISAEHKALGYRPPTGSLAAEAQAAAAKNPEVPARIPAEQLTKVAVQDALRIKNERAVNGVDLSAIGEAQARALMSEEHKALGYRPPPGSLASQAQTVAAKHPAGASFTQPPVQSLQRAALEDATVVGESSTADNIDLNFIGAAEARRLMSEEHKILGYRPPQGSLAASAQAAAAKHPHANAGVDAATLAKAALEDAKKIEAQRRASRSPDAKLTVDQNPITSEVRIDKQVEVVSHSSSLELLGGQLESASDQTSAAGDEPVAQSEEAENSIQLEEPQEALEGSSAAVSLVAQMDLNEVDVGGGPTSLHATL